MTIKTAKLKSKTVGKNAFAKINAKAKIKVPKSKLKSYKKLLKSKGIKGKKQKIKKYLAICIGLMYILENVTREKTVKKKKMEGRGK